ncbi:phycobilisome Linker polypeptide [Synechococcus sp. RSCCF101]|uniref:phycobilisome rod-core linker polypeptide n=1 Tax=Synechococcus sp. RSCCF101 TaxID=2511069 RepID=UPI0012461CCE|nr:phycobilisome rod-core linker polypeptide [Synechococcus sp. RSCCF101]QEY32127.1 phycobilisome Linker polypeptide [Synechococcus sp. RSCCF101]
MALPVLETPFVSQNARVHTFTAGGDEAPRVSEAGLQGGPSVMRGVSVEEQINQAYYQLFFHTFQVDREPVLESQLRDGRITVKEFVRGLLLSSRFRDGFYGCNSNYRVADHLVGRVLGRQPHGDQERIALSILLANGGLEGLVDHLLESEEYEQAFGEHTVPFQRNRVLAGRATGDRPTNQRLPRYDAYWRDMSAQRAPAGAPGGGWGAGWGAAPAPTGPVSAAWQGGQPPRIALQIWLLLGALGAIELVRVLATTAGAMLSTGS